MVASGGVLSEGYGHGGPGVCLGDGQTEAKGVPSQGGCGGRAAPAYVPITDLTYWIECPQKVDKEALEGCDTDNLCVDVVERIFARMMYRASVPKSGSRPQKGSRLKNVGVAHLNWGSVRSRRSRSEWATNTPTEALVLTITSYTPHRYEKMHEKCRISV